MALTEEQFAEQIKNLSDEHGGKSFEVDVVLTINALRVLVMKLDARVKQLEMEAGVRRTLQRGSNPYTIGRR